MKSNTTVTRNFFFFTAAALLFLALFKSLAPSAYHQIPKYDELLTVEGKVVDTYWRKATASKYSSTKSFRVILLNTVTGVIEVRVHIIRKMKVPKIGDYVITRVTPGSFITPLWVWDYKINDVPNLTYEQKVAIRKGDHHNFWVKNIFFICAIAALLAAFLCGLFLTKSAKT